MHPSQKRVKELEKGVREYSHDMMTTMTIVDMMEKRLGL